MDCANVVQNSSGAAFAEHLQSHVSGALKPGLAVFAPSTSLSTDANAVLRTAQLALHFCICPPLCPSFKIRDLSYFGDSPSFSCVAFMLTPEKARKDCHLEPSAVNRIDDECNQVVSTQFDVFQNIL